jgi:hypothetical protein
MSGTGTKGGFVWREGESFAELARLGDNWEISYGFEATATSARRVVQRATTPDYADAVRQLWQVIGYYFAEPEHAERVRQELLGRAGLELGESKYLPVPDVKYLTGAGGGAGGEDEATAEAERRARILRGESPDAPPAAAPAPPEEKRPWWRRLGRGTR